MNIRFIISTWKRLREDDRVNVAIISVGTELLMGDIVNTNAVYLSQEMTKLGMRVLHHLTVGDNPERLKKILEFSLTEADLILLTGGLGPTEDDLTREVCAQVLGLDLQFNSDIWEGIKQYLGKEKKDDLPSENNRKQAMVPKGAQVLVNGKGTAPGLILSNEDGKQMILMPGPPRELYNMFESQVVPRLKKNLGRVLESRYIRFFGIGEAPLEMRLKDILDNQTNPTLALYAKTSEVLMRITAMAETSEASLALINEKIKEIRQRGDDEIYLVGDQSIAQSQSEMANHVADLLIRHHLGLAVAESLTGGEVASQFVSVPGISTIFQEGIVTYSNESKVERLKVRPETLSLYGAVSKEVAREMVLGLIKEGIEVAVATTGVAGPSRDKKENPIGLTYIATYYKGQIQVTDYQFYGDREMIRQRASLSAMNQIRLMLKANGIE